MRLNAHLARNILMARQQYEEMQKKVSSGQSDKAWDLVLPRTRCIECVVAGVNTRWVRYVYKIRDLLQTQQVSYKNETFFGFLQDFS